VTQDNEFKLISVTAIESISDTFYERNHFWMILDRWSQILSLCKFKCL